MKTIIFINLRFANFYSKNLFAKLKKEQAIRLVAIVDQQFENKIDASIAPYLDALHVLPAETKQGFLAEFDYTALKKIVVKERENNVDVHLICSDEFNLLNTGRLRRELNLHGHTDKELMLYRDKLKMKAHLAKAGIRVPHFKKLAATDTFENLARDIGLPFVLKPIDSCGSHGVAIIESAYQFSDYLKQCAFKEEIEVEEYIQGKLYHVDSLTVKKELKFICANEYTCPNVEYTQGKSLGSLPLEKTDKLAERLMFFAKNCLHILDANHLVNHMELFVTKDQEIVFLEVSARPPGGLVNEMHQNNFGINLMDQDFFMQSEINLALETLAATEKSFFTLFPLQAGKIKKLVMPITQSRAKLCWEVTIDQVIGEEVCKNVVNKAAVGVFYHTDINVLREDFEVLKRHNALEMYE